MIGLCTPFKIDNYGTKLQAYAVQEKIRELNYEFEIIDFDRKSDMRINKLISRYCNKEFIEIKLKRKKNARDEKNDLAFKHNLKIRKDAINSFDSTHYKLTPKIKGYNNLKKYAKKYNALICGSDQIWLPLSINNPTSTLEFASKGCRRIAFAPSFGISEIPSNLKSKYEKFLKKFDSLSVREFTGVQMIKDIAGRDSENILDPTLTVKKEVWDKLSDSCRYNYKEKYIFCYFLGNNEEHRKAVYDFAKKNNLKIVTMPHFKGYNEYDEKYTDIRLYDVTPCDFVGLIKGAEYVCTDSFHSTVFSIIYNKKFFTFERFNKNDKKSANSRIYSLLTLLNLKNQIIENSEKIELHNSEIDYKNVELKLEELRNKTNEYLKNALDGINKAEKKENKAFSKINKEKCCGCGACVEICPQKCLTMDYDVKDGFAYPKIEKKELCKNCGLCKMVCPNQKERNYSHNIGDTYFAYNKNQEIREKSASGGIFYELAKEIIEQKGYVCGAVYNEKFEVEHIVTNNFNELERMIGSKYSESKLGKCYSKIKQLLDNGEKVCFAGTPCQAHGLKSYLRKEYDNLFVIDLFCYGIQSPKAWKKYKDDIEKKYGKSIKKINMRDKSISWQNYSMCIEFDDGEKQIFEKEKDSYLRSYSKGIFIRPSCFKCNLKAFPRVSDLTIGDFWDIDKIMPEKNDQKGAGQIKVNSDKGEDWINRIIKRNYIFFERIDDEKLVKVHPLFGLNAKKSKKSEKFYSLMNKDVSFEKCIKKTEESKIKKKIKKIIKKIRR